MKTDNHDVSEFPIESIYEMMKLIYDRSDSLCQTFEEKYPSILELKTEVERHKQTPGSIFLIHSGPSHPQGFITVQPRGSSRLCHTADLCMGVVPQSQSLGIGRTLLKRTLELVHSQNRLKIIYLCVRADHSKAVRLYQSEGFEVLCVLEKDFFLKNIYYDGLLMRKFYS